MNPNSRRLGRVTRWVVGGYLMPMVIFAVILAASAGGLGVLCGVFLAVLAFQVWSGGLGRYLGLSVGLMCWFGGLMLCLPLVGLVAPIWFAIFLVGAVVIVLTVVACRIALPWGAARGRRLAAAGRPIREWEWVYTGRSFALSHPLAAVRGGVLLTIGFILLQWLVLAIVAFFSPEPTMTWGLFSATTVLTFLTLGTLIRRHPAAWVLVWIHLITGLPLSLPLVIYWADGRRPNLIYRHRFERLVLVQPIGEADVR